MTASALTLTDFLLARIAEDEEVARACKVSTSPFGFEFDIDNESDYRLTVTGTRVLAECEAKRRIVTLYLAHDHEADAGHKWSGFDGGYATATDHVLSALLLPYAEHPDCDPEWLP